MEVTAERETRERRETAFLPDKCDKFAERGIKVTFGSL